MSTPINPKHMADEVLLTRFHVNYMPEWDEVQQKWQLDTTKVTINVIGTSGLNGLGDHSATVTTDVIMADMPQSAQDALIQMNAYFEQALADMLNAVP